MDIVSTFLVSAVCLQGSGGCSEISNTYVQKNPEFKHQLEIHERKIKGYIPKKLNPILIVGSSVYKGFVSIKTTNKSVLQYFYKENRIKLSITHDL